jgi:uncharacterized protein
MPALEVVALDMIPSEPWRNGGGVTRTVARQDDDWRISIADVCNDGPYSRFEGMTRVSLVLCGAGIVLRERQSGATIELRSGHPVQYDGEKLWDAALIDGPVSVLNVMSKAASFRATVTQADDQIDVESGCAAVILALRSTCTLRADSSESQEVEVGHAALLLDGAAVVSVDLKPSQRDDLNAPIVIKIGRVPE